MGFSTALVLFAYTVHHVMANSERIDILDVVRIEEVPFAVLVLSNNNKMFCTGTLLDESWVLTTAHCLYDNDGLFTEDDGSVTVIAGTDRLAYSLKDVAANRTQIRQSERIIVHSDYSYAENFINDLALIKLQHPVIIGPRVAIANLSGRPPLSERYVHRHSMPSHADIKPFLCEVYGFGKMQRYVDHKNDYSIKIQQLEVAKHCHCLEKLRSIRHPYNVLRKKNKFICDELSSWAGLCLGDNGAQLVCDGLLRGIGTAIVHYDITERCSPSDWRRECGDMQTLSVFTDLCPYSGWIAEHVNVTMAVVPGAEDSCILGSRMAFEDDNEDD